MLPEKTEGLKICGERTNRSSYDEICYANDYNKILGGETPPPPPLATTALFTDEMH